jgi:bifunctional DNA-binding transcriptional regulator/antitoxin component of YhaV-PrlF toxin-antitoxin module
MRWDVAFGRVPERGRVPISQTVRRQVGLEPDDLLAFHVAGPGHIEITRLPRLTLEAALERYRIEEPVDGDRDWTTWEAAANEALGDGADR